ncbi:hypothetical protein NC652_021981 [Populus alba x Populus x berolinensis]|nr:hypothetical protein NC652_021981 [Populus alba x Populus x berolinensis]
MEDAASQEAQSWFLTAGVSSTNKTSPFSRRWDYGKVKGFCKFFGINELGFLVGAVNGPLTMGSIKAILYPARQRKRICPCAAITFVSGKKIS